MLALRALRHAAPERFRQPEGHCRVLPGHVSILHHCEYIVKYVRLIIFNGHEAGPSQPRKSVTGSKLRSKNTDL
jgi:hypothetical protein